MILYFCITRNCNNLICIVLQLEFQIFQTVIIDYYIPCSLFCHNFLNIANELTVFLRQFKCVLSNKEIQIWHSLLIYQIVGRWDIFIDDVWHLQYNYCRFRHAVVSAMTGTKKRVGSGHKSARFAELVKQVQSINQASREGKMPAGQCAQPVFWANDKIKELLSHFLTIKKKFTNFPYYCTVSEIIPFI